MQRILYATFNTLLCFLIKTILEHVTGSDKLVQRRGQEFTRFETVGFYPILLLPLLFFSLLFAAAIYVGHSVGMLIFGLLSLFLLLGSLVTIEVSSDGIVIKRMMFGTSHWRFEEVKFKAGGRVLA